ncbi:glycosyltransferase family 87 protein [Chryseobacterium sp. CH21]|uniref:glycosyltransferase family 87 protein n=1 Tax=Chryseobacterium sp. CH21 TaxID=713556 RepID=UPI0013E961F9|nr:glycosyltransferase family 87 protein [Chryseobacterium sp. CH21]
MAIVSALKQYFHAKYNNYLIFKYVFWHTRWEKPLYEQYPAEYFDSNHYGPFFSVVIAPFALMPDWLGMTLWNLLNALILLYGIFTLPISDTYKKIIAWIVLHECLTALLSFQFNVAITGLILLSFTYIEKQKPIKSAFVAIIGFLVKLYGIVVLAFFLFIKRKITFILSAVAFLLVFFGLPMLISSPEFVMKSYMDWFNVLIFKSHDNEFNNQMADLSFLGFIRKTTGIYINVLYGCAFAGIILIIILLRNKMCRLFPFRFLILAYVFLCLVLFNTNVESPTYILGFMGIAIWFTLVPKNPYTISLLVFAIILTSLSPTDLFPKPIREKYVIPYALKAVPCIFIWFDVAYRLLFDKFSTVKKIKMA